jgi:hypothetical protein
MMNDEVYPLSVHHSSFIIHQYGGFPMATGDLITAARAIVNLPGVSQSDTSLLALITAASRAVQKYCRRWFVQASYDELYNGNGQRRLFLRNFPVVSVQSVRYRPVTVLKVINNDTATNQQARVTVTSTGLTLVRVASGVSSTDTSCTFAGSPTLQALANAMTALGHGWSGQLDDLTYTLWPSADLWCPQGLTSDPDYSPAGQGALTAWGQFAELKMHTYELAGYQIADRGGWLLRAIPYTDPELLHPEDLVWPTGINNLRVQYTAGYGTVPEDVQEATAEWVASLYEKAQRLDPAIIQQSQAGLSHKFNDGTLPAVTAPPAFVRRLLAPYRIHKITIGGG